MRRADVWKRTNTEMQPLEPGTSFLDMRSVILGLYIDQ